MNEDPKLTVLLKVASEWLAQLEATGRSPRTIVGNEVILRRLDLFLIGVGRGRPQDVLAADLEAWRLHLVRSGCKSSTIDLYLSVARRLFQWLLATGYIFSDPEENLSAGKVLRPLGSCPSEQDMRRLLKSVAGQTPSTLRDRALLELAYSTGARLKEFAALDLDAISGTMVRLRGKCGRERMVPLTTMAVKALNAYLKKGRPHFVGDSSTERGVFVSHRGHGRRLSHQAIAFIIKSRAKKCGLKLTSHSIRRGFATHLLQGGAALAEVKEMLGHQSFHHLHHYLRLHPSEMLAGVRNGKPCRR